MLGLNKTQKRKSNYTDIEIVEGLQVQKTYNYSYFNKLDGNRTVTKAAYSKLLKSIQKKSLKIPIIVNEKYEIIDGQTRFKCWKELEKPIYFIMVDGYGLEDCGIANTNIKTWNIDDFANCYSTLGDKNFKIYLEFREKYKFEPYASISMLKGQINGNGHNFDYFREGYFKINSYKKACEWADQIYKVKDLYVGFKRRSFVLAMLHLLNHKNFNINVFIKKLTFQQTKLVNCSTKEQYLHLLQEIYNYHSTKKVNLIYND